MFNFGHLHSSFLADSSIHPACFNLLHNALPGPSLSNLYLIISICIHPSSFGTALLKHRKAVSTASRPETGRFHGIALPNVQFYGSLSFRKEEDTLR